MKLTLKGILVAKKQEVKTTNYMQNVNKSMKSITVFANDPGSRNSGFAIVKGTLDKRRRLQIKVVKNGMLFKLVTQLKDNATLNKEAEEFKQTIVKIVNKFGIDQIIIERFMTRGLGGPLIEIVSVMIGLVLGIVPVQAIPAVTWKVWAKKQSLDLDAMYKAARVPPHQVDSVCMAIFKLAKELDAKIVKFNNKKLLAIIEATSTTKLKNKRKPK